MSVDQPFSTVAEPVMDGAGVLQTASNASRVATGSEGASELLEVDNLTVRFDQRGRRVYAVNGISYKLGVGRTIAIIGESGSGKTVASRALMGLLPETATIRGSVKLEGKQLLGLDEKSMRKHRGLDIAMVFQDPSRSLNPVMRVGPQVAEAMRLHMEIDRKAAQERCIELFRMVRLPSPEQKFFEYPHQLSGGMRQRVMIAMALACRPKVLIADEATTALDVTTQAQIMELLMDLQEEFHMAVIMISHNLGLAASFADEVMVMYAGRAVEQALTRELFSNVRMPYTRTLLDAIPRLEHRSHTAFDVPGGAAAEVSSLPVGCSFAPRCPKAQDKCRESTPLLEGPDLSHRWACWYPYGTNGGAA